MPSSRQVGQHLGLGIARPQRVLGLHGGDRVDGVRAPDRLGRRLAEPEVEDLALLHELGHRADGLLDRHVRDRRGAGSRGRRGRCRAAAASPRSSCARARPSRRAGRWSRGRRAASSARCAARTWSRSRTRRGGPRSRGRRAPRWSSARRAAPCRGSRSRAPARAGSSRSPRPRRSSRRRPTSPCTRARGRRPRAIRACACSLLLHGWRQIGEAAQHVAGHVVRRPVGGDRDEQPAITVVRDEREGRLREQGQAVAR